MRFQRCPHDGGIKALVWRDSAGLTWVDETCKKCGRIWRTRLMPFGKRARNDGEAAA